MGKVAPEELWRRHILERFEAFRQSGELEKLRKEGLAACGRKKRFTVLEWWRSSISERHSSLRYVAWYRKCKAVAQKYGLMHSTVECACLVSDYQPDKSGLVVESKWPKIRVITESTDAQFLIRLAYEAQLRGLHVIARHGSEETTCLFMNSMSTSRIEPPPLSSSMPPLDSAFYMRVETPIGYPPQAARNLHKDASQLEKDILIALGYSIPKRLRTSKLVAMADKLRVADALATGEAYNIVDDIYGEDLTDDQKKRRLVVSRRHKVLKRWVKRYETN